MNTRQSNTPLDERSGQRPGEDVQIQRARGERRLDPRLATNELKHLVWMDHEGLRCCVQVQLLDRSDDGVGFECSVCFEAGQMVWIELDDELHRSVVRYCKDKGDVYRVGLLRIRRERRQSYREPTVGTATLEVGGISTSAIIRNVSVDGIQIETGMEVPVSEVVRLSGRTIECLAVTRYCRAHQGHYLTGLRVLRLPDADASDNTGEK